MNSSIYDKTDKGRDEIATRKNHLSSRLRTMLVMVDGRHTATDLLAKVAGLGLNQENLQELIDQHYIIMVGIGESFLKPPPARVAPPVQEVERPQPPKAAAVAPPPAEVMDEGQRFQALYDFYNQTIKSTIGLRGFSLQLKVEKAISIDDFRMLRRPYLEAVLKTKGNEMARSLRDRLDHLLGGKPEHESVILPGDWGSEPTTTQMRKPTE